MLSCQMMGYVKMEQQIIKYLIFKRINKQNKASEFESISGVAYLT